MDRPTRCLAQLLLIPSLPRRGQMILIGIKLALGIGSTRKLCTYYNCSSHHLNHPIVNSIPSALTPCQRVAAMFPSGVPMTCIRNSSTEPHSSPARRLFSTCKLRARLRDLMQQSLTIGSWFYRIRPSVAHQPMSELPYERQNHDVRSESQNT